MNEPKYTEVSAGSQAVRLMAFTRAGDANQGEAHTYDHFTLIAYGAVRVLSNGRVTDVEAPAMVFIPKGVSHTITALRDGTVAACLHALHSRDDPGQVLDGAIIPPGTPPWSLAVPLLAKTALAQGYAP